MRVRYLLPLAAAAGVALFAMAPVSAQDADYPPAEPVLSVSSATVVVGDSVLLTGTGFDPNETVLIQVSTAPLAAPGFTSEGVEADPVVLQPVARTVSAQAEQTVQADGDGAFSATVTLWEVGRATISATGTESGLSASVVVTVVAAANGLPSTGSEVGRMLWVGGAAVGSGALLLLLGTLAWRRRQHQNVDG